MPVPQALAVVGLASLVDEPVGACDTKRNAAHDDAERTRNRWPMSRHEDHGMHRSAGLPRTEVASRNAGIRADALDVPCAYPCSYLTLRRRWTLAMSRQGTSSALHTKRHDSASDSYGMRSLRGGTSQPAYGRNIREGCSMTNKAAFTPDEWISVIEGPTSAGLVVVTASHGGTFRETFAMSKAYVEARSAHGKSEILDEIVNSKPKVEHAHARSADELTADALQRVRTGVAVLESKATADEVEEYRQFVLTVAHKVAAAHREDGQDVSPAEAAAIEEIRSSLGAAT